ncbi:MAG: adenylate/guanylate cyclase domain-containing protein [Bacteroidota bacterium]
MIPAIKKISVLTFLFFCFQFSVKANQTPLDSIKQVLRTLDIPYELQEAWMEDLEDLENEQNGYEFKRLMARVDRQIKSYLVNPESYQTQDKPKIKLKDRLNKIGKGIDRVVNKGINQAEIVVALEKGKNAEYKESYAEAIHHYLKAVEGFESQENWDKWIVYQEKIADLMAGKLSDFDGALAILPKVKNKMRELGDGSGMRTIDIKIKNLEKKLNVTTVKEAPPVILPNTPSASSPRLSPTTPNPPTPPPTPNMEVISAQKKKLEADYAQAQQEIANSQREMEEAKEKLKRAEEMGRSSREIAALKRSIENSEKKRLAEVKEAESLKKNLMEQQLLLAEKEKELSQQAAQQLRLYGGLGILGLLLFSTFFLYKSKQKDHQKLTTAYDELATAQEELKVAEQKIKGLLDQQVSGAVAAELLAGADAKTTEHARRFVCIMFLDIRNFTPFVESKTPEQIIEYQNNVLGFMMEKVIEHKGIVNTVLGDGFMATFGAPVSAGNDCLQAYKAAVEIMQMVRQKSQSGQIPPTKIGIGLHAGNVVAGNVGTKTRKQYLITGNTVIIASRLEQLNKQYGSSLILSREVVERLPSAMNLPTTFDKVMVKGRSKPVEIAKYG